MRGRLWQIVQLAASFASAYALATILHELGHALTGSYYGLHPVLHHDYVAYGDVHATAQQQLWTAANGPLTSLLLGLLSWLLLRLARGPGPLRLWLLWMQLVNLFMFLGYLCIAPFVPYGDTGKVIQLLNVSTPIALTAAGLAMGGIAMLMRVSARLLPAALLGALPMDGRVDERVLRAMFGWSLLLGTAVNVIVSLPSPTPISLILPFCLSLAVVPLSFGISSERLTTDAAEGSAALKPASTVWPLALLLLLALTLRLLVQGVAL